MTNPVFSNSAIFGDPRSRRTRKQDSSAAPVGGTVLPQPPTSSQQYASGYATDPSQLNEMYAAPSAAPAQTGRLTYDDVIMKTIGLLGLAVLVGAVTWFLASSTGNLEALLPVAIVGAIGALVFGLINSFKREPNPTLIVIYTCLEGVFLGAISALFETLYPGIVFQAVLATIATFAVTLLVYRSGKIRVTAKMSRYVIIALCGYLLFQLINIGLMALGVTGNLRTDVTIMGIPLGVIVGIAAVLLAAFSFMVDFESIKRGVEAGVPAKYAWSAAFGLLVTLVWLYLEFLRLLSIFMRD